MKARHILPTTILTLMGVASVSAPVMAMSEPREASLEFTFESVLTVDVSEGDIVIDDLEIGEAGLSNEIDITVETTNPGGYKLSATTGNAENTTRNLVKDTNNYFTGIATDANVSTLNDNTWGFTTNSGATFSGLALYTDSVPTLLNSSNSPVSGNAGKTSFAIGVKSSDTQASGAYTNVISFTAVPNVVTPTGPRITDIVYMQEFATLSSGDKASVIASMTENQAYQLVDNRDNTVYHIAKLADGKVWMLDNLALDLTNEAVQSKLSSLNTNATNTSINALLHGGRANGDNYANTGVSNWTSSYSYSAPLVNLTNKDVIPSNAPQNSKGNNKVGGYYNYCAASAGSYCYGDGTSEGISSGNATEDICPAGWRMPTGNTAGEYQSLVTAVTGKTGYFNDATLNATFRTALSLPLSGFFYYGSASIQGSGGDFWSSTRRNEYGMYSLYVSTGSVEPADYRNLDYGYSVRCIAR